MAKRIDLSDEDVLGAFIYSGPLATYVLRNILARGGRKDLKTSAVLTRLRRLEQAGKVKCVRDGYAVMLSWVRSDGKVAPGAGVFSS